MGAYGGTWTRTGETVKEVITSNKSGFLLDGPN
jgi:hypothetical protein